MRLIKKLYPALLIALLLFLILPFLYLVLPSKIKDYVYRELCYHTVIDGIKADSANLGDFLQNSISYVYTNMDSHGHNMPIIDDNSWNALVRGFGYCDQQAWALCTLLAKTGIPARLVMLKGRNPVSGHSLAEIYVEGRWRIVDPHMNAVYYNKAGELATFGDIENGRVNLKAVAREGFSLDLYKSYFEKAYPPDRWQPLTAKQGIARKLVFFPVYFYYRLIGPKFSRFYQNLYLMGKDAPFAERNRYLIIDKFLRR